MTKRVVISKPLKVIAVFGDSRNEFHINEHSVIVYHKTPSLDMAYPDRGSSHGGLSQGLSPGGWFRPLALASMIALNDLRVYIQNIRKVMLTARAHGLKSL